jgi:ribosomal-protein-alanine N-acetyltransferase
MTTSIHIRVLCREDSEAVAYLFEKSIEEGGATGWDNNSVRNLIQAGGFGFVAEIRNTVIGACIVLPAGEDAELLNVATDMHHRRLGAAYMLLRSALSSATSSGSNRMILEVADDNFAAKSLYNAFGFKKIGLRRAYYKRGTQTVDADVFALELKPSL